MIDARRNVVAIGAGAEEEGHLARNQIPAGHGGELPFDGQFGGMIGQPLDLAREPRRLGNIDEQVVDRGRADRAEHLLTVAVG